ncbi:E3 ubiquitin-protein ligase TTC3-like isoform X2 [Rhopilema esculentum]|uniref:E3 ubiquitin-protein ligase TTC3-like isoform X2 n=1 Tax=Rhopilema esculentum TaxID=499914 RepID=UPI0031DF192A
MMKPKNKKEANASKEVSESLISFWWKLSVRERKSHFETIKVDLLSPFLFCGSYRDKFCLRWAKDIAILNSDSTQVLRDEIYRRIDLFEEAVTVLQESLSKFEGKKHLDGMIKSMEGIRKEYKGTQAVPSATTTLKGIGQQDWFKHFRSNMVDSRIIDRNFRDTTLLISSMKVFIYIESLKLGEFPLETYREKATISDGKILIDKETANRHFTEKKYEKAITMYTNILDVKPYCHIIYSNRAQCYLSLGRHRLALADARRAIALNPSSEKGQYRFCRSLELLGKQDDAARAVRRALQACPESADLEKLQRRIRQKLDSSQVARRMDLILRSDEPPELVSPSSGDQSSESSDSFRPNFSDSEDEDFEESCSSEVPVLVSDSDEWCDDDSHESIEESVKEVKKTLKTKKRLPASSVKKIKGKISNSAKEDNMPNLQIEMKKGTKFFMAKNYDCASTYFNLVLNLSKSKKNLSLSREDEVILIYAYGMCSFESGSTEDMGAAKKQFDLIIEKFKDVNFPLAHYGCGRIYHRQSKFSEMQISLHKALDIIARFGVVLRRWPGSDFVIEETKPGKLEYYISQLLTSAVGSARLPDAVCRFDLCDLSRNIFKDDLDFKGYIQMKCSEACKIEYHSVCWQKVKKKLNFKDQSPLKDFLNRKCLTPDCSGLLYFMHYTFLNRDGEIKNKEHKIELPRKQNTGVSKIDKSKRMKPCSHKKLMKKSSLEEEKEKKKMEKIREIDDDITNILNELDEEENMRKHITEIPLLNSRTPFSYRDAALFPLRKEEVSAGNASKQGTKGRRKKKNKGSQNLTTFIGEEETNSLRQVLQEVRKIERSPSLSSSAASSNFDLSSTVFEQSQIQGFDFASECSRDTVVEHLHSIFADLLVSKGRMNVETDSDVKDLLDILDIYSSRVINSYGGLRLFLASSPKFAFDPDDPNIVYLAEEAEIYLFSKREAAKQKRKGFYKDNEALFIDDAFSGKDKNRSPKKTSVMATDPAIVSILPESNNTPKSKTKNSKKISNSSIHAKSDINGGGPTIVHCISNFGGVVVDDAPFYTDNSFKINGNQVLFKSNSHPSVKKLETISKQGKGKKSSDEISGHNSGHYVEQLRNEMIRKSDQIEAEKVIEVSRVAAEKKDVAVMTESGFNNNNNGNGWTREDDGDEDIHDAYVRALDSCEQMKNKLKITKEAASVKESELKSELESLKSKLMKEQQSRESAQKKWQQEKDKLSGTIKSLYEKIASFDENRYKIKLQDQEREMEKMSMKIGELRLQKEQIVSENQDIIDKLSTCVTEQSVRAQKAEVLFMELKKAEICNDFTRSLENVQRNIYTIENNPFLEQTVSRSEMLKIWKIHQDVVSKILRTWMTEMEERIQMIKDGTPLDEIPPLPVPQSPPCPPQPKMIPFPANPPNQANPIPIPGFAFGNAPIPSMIVPSNAANQQPTDSVNGPRTASPTDVNEHMSLANVADSDSDPGSAQAVAVAQASFANSAAISISTADTSAAKAKASPRSKETRGAEAKPAESKVEKVTSSKTNEKGASKSTSFEKIMVKLCSQYPSIPRDELITCLKQFREKRNNTLAGLRVEEIITGVSKMIKESRFEDENNKMLQKQAKIKAKAFGFEEPCIICHEDMFSIQSTRLQCKHVFHTECIKRWLKEQRTCPTCRDHALLPSEYPSLR